MCLSPFPLANLIIIIASQFLLSSSCRRLTMETERSGRGEAGIGVKGKEGTHHASVLAVSQDANVSQSQLDEALVHEVHGGSDVQRDRCLFVVSIRSLMFLDRDGGKRRERRETQGGGRNSGLVFRPPPRPSTPTARKGDGTKSNSPDQQKV